MDIKKPDRRKKRQPKPEQPQRNNSTFFDFRPARRANPANKGSTAKSSRATAKTADTNTAHTSRQNSSKQPKITAPSKIAAKPRGRRASLIKKTVIVAGLVIVASGAGLLTYRHYGSGGDDAGPAYQTILPEGKSINQLGGWQRISPPENDPVFAYADKIGDIPVSVSQQPLPMAFKDNVEGQVAELAKKFNATTEIDAGGTKLYVGTSAKGPQSAILAKNNLLIMIKSQKVVADEAWAEYAKSLN